MTPIEAKVEILQDIAAEISGQLQAIQVMRGTAAVEIAAAGLTQATCAALAGLMAQLHEDTARLHNGGHLVHQLMAQKLPAGMNEGNKTGWPPQP